VGLGEGNEVLFVMDNCILVVSLDSLVSDHDLYGLITIPSNKSDAVIISIKILVKKIPDQKPHPGLNDCRCNRYKTI